MLLRSYQWEMNYRFKQFARNFGILKHQPICGFKYAIPKLLVKQFVRYNSSALISKDFIRYKSNTLINKEFIRYKSGTPMNTIILFVPEQEVWIVERMGKFHKSLKSGLNFLIPIVDKVRYVQCLKELVIEISQQSAITSDSVSIDIDGVLYLKVIDPFLASYGIDDPEFAVIQIAQTTMRSELGKLPFEKVFREREGLSSCIVDCINKASAAWGITCLRFEIRNMKVPERIYEAMQMQVEAERKKRVIVLRSEGIKEGKINIAEGKRLARILASEAAKEEDINKATGAATALVTIAEARAKSLKLVANALNVADGRNAAAYNIAEQYIKAFDKLAKVNNTLILPSNVSNVSSLVTQAMTIYKQVMAQPILDNKDEKKNTDAIEVNESDEAFEYFSDKEEAEKHKKHKRK